jgi:curved DNA-binding protein CbpA
MSTPEPIASGTLEKTPLPHLLVYLDQKRLSGTLAIWPEASAQGAAGGKGQDRILLLKGRPVAGRLIEPAQTLRDGMLRLFSRHEAPYAFYDTNLLGDDRVNGRVDPYALIAESLRHQAQDEVVAKVLARYHGMALRLLPGADLGRYQLQPDEQTLVQQLRTQPMDLATAVQASGLDEQHAIRLIYLLTITKALEPTGAAPAQPAAPAAPAQPQPAVASPPPAQPPPAQPPVQPAAPAQSAPTSAQPTAAAAVGAEDAGGEQPLHADLDRLNSIPPPPEHLSDEHRERWLQIVAKGRLIENQNFFEMLDVKRNAKADEARTRFYQLAKQWHPDRLPQELAPIREYVQIIFSYMSEAHATLGDEEQRIKYIQTVRDGGGTPASDRLMQAILEMAMEYERVMVMSRKHEYADAIPVMNRILDVVKDEPDYYAMNAWLLMQHYGKREDAPLDAMMESVDRALELYADHEKANMLKAQLYRRMGKQGDALRYFKKVADINPKNIEAVREVRIATMRKENAGPLAARKDEDGVGGLIGKLFKRK